MALIKLKPTECKNCGAVHKKKIKLLTSRSKHFPLKCEKCGHTNTIDDKTKHDSGRMLGHNVP